MCHAISYTVQSNCRSCLLLKKYGAWESESYFSERNIKYKPIDIQNWSIVTKNVELVRMLMDENFNNLYYLKRLLHEIVLSYFNIALIDFFVI